MEIAEWKLWFDVAQFVLTGCIGIYVYLMNRSRVTRESIKRVDDRVDNLTQRVTAVETEIKHLPDDDDIVRVHSRLDEVSKQLSETVGRLEAVTHSLQLIESHLLNK